MARGIGIGRAGQGSTSPRGRSQIDTALAALRDAEEMAAAIARELASGSELEAERRGAHEAARAALTDLQLRDARALSDVAGTQRDRQRLEQELAAAEADLAVQRREQAAPVPSRDLALSAAVAEGERALAEALEELSSIRAAEQAEGEALAALRRVEAARTAEVETARRRLADAERQAADERAQADEVARRLGEAEKACAGPKAALAKALDDEKAAVAARETARAELDQREGARQAASERASAASSRVAGLRGRLDGLQARLAEEETRGIAKAARRVGGKPLSDGLDVEAGFRVAVEAALGEAMRGYIVGKDAALELSEQRGILVIETAEPEEGRRPAGRDAARDRAAAAADAAADAVAAAAGVHGGGRLSEALRVDPGGAASRLLARSVWVPDLTAALEVQPKLPIGWIVVTREGARCDFVRCGEPGPLRVDARTPRGAGAARGGSGASGDRRGRRHRRGRGSREGRCRGARCPGSRARDANAGPPPLAASPRNRNDVPPAPWRRSRARPPGGRRRPRAWRRIATGCASRCARRQPPPRRRAARPAMRPPPPPRPPRRRAAPATARAASATPSTPAQERTNAIREWETRADALRARRDQLAAEEAVLESTRRDAEARRARAAAAANFDQERIASLERQTADLVRREQEIGSLREALGEELAAAGLREAAVRAQLDEIRAAAAASRTRLAEAEAAAMAARERLRVCQDRARTAEVAELEARLALESIREQVLVELAGLGDLGIRLLINETRVDLEAAASRGIGNDDDDYPPLPAAPAGFEDGADGEDNGNGITLESVLGEAAALWAQASAVEPPSSGKLATLRRRFHELGAAQPVRGRGVRAAQDAPGRPRGAARGSDERHLQDARPHRAAQRDDRDAVPRRHSRRWRRRSTRASASCSAADSRT